MRCSLGAIVLTVSAAVLGASAMFGNAQAPNGTAAPKSADAPKQGVVNPAPTAKDYADLGKLPDWSGVWYPNRRDQATQIKTNPTPWNEKAAKMIARQDADQKAGKPELIFYGCLPENHPSWMLVSHNAMEILFTPGRVTMLGESDGNRLRRIYTDGRGHPEESDPSFHGHSTGHWEGNVLVVDTVDIFPQAPLVISEAHGVPNNGDMRVRERIYLADPDLLHVELEITAPHILTKPWTTTRKWRRHRARKFDIVEGVCVLGNYAERVDADGNHIFVEVARTPLGNVAPLGD
ncbi:MAG: hypothetical protein QOI12_4599 [Alphaproteobacteria bacterium]|jgi:hypothetical protein|nr:hypothetical protein [Alphaproteobacteria bacterium]